MKSILLVSLFFFAAAANAIAPLQTTVPITNVFVPAGFDSNDSSEVIIAGYLPNLCYKYPQAKAYVEGDKIEVRLEALFYHPEDGVCLQATVPFVETVRLGVLKQGVYDIHVNRNAPRDDHRGQAELMIDAAPSEAIDNFIYARVESIKIAPNSRVVALKGNNPSDCFEFKEIRLFSNKKDTYAVLPILEKVAEVCPLKLVPFEYHFTVPDEFEVEDILLHVRSMNGKSVNAIFKNR